MQYIWFSFCEYFQIQSMNYSHLLLQLSGEVSPRYSGGWGSHGLLVCVRECGQSVSPVSPVQGPARAGTDPAVEHQPGPVCLSVWPEEGSERSLPVSRTVPARLAREVVRVHPARSAPPSGRSGNMSSEQHRHIHQHWRRHITNTAVNTDNHSVSELKSTHLYSFLQTDWRDLSNNCRQNYSTFSPKSFLHFPIISLALTNEERRPARTWNWVLLTWF